MSKKVLVILGHPRTDSYCAALARAYVEGAKAAGAEVRELHLSELQFDPVCTRNYDAPAPLEPDLARAQQDIKWAWHLVFVYPVWWGTLPALLKGFIERTFLPGFAVEFREDDSPFWDQLLTGRSARLLVTMDSPPWYYRWIARQPGHNTMKRTILGFCGVKPVRISAFGPIKGSSEREREKWLADARELGAKLS